MRFLSEISWDLGPGKFKLIEKAKQLGDPSNKIGLNISETV